MQKVIAVAVVIVIFIIAQYSGLSSINIFSNSKSTLKQGSSGLLATDAGSNLYIVWSEFNDKEIVLASSTPTNFKIDKIKSNTSLPLSRSIEAIGSNIYITWVDDYLKPSKIMFSKGDNGDKLSTVVIRETDYVLDYPIIKVSGPVVYIAWIEYIDYRYQVLLRYSHDNGSTFSDIIKINESKNDGGSISMEVKGRSLYITWHEKVDNNYQVLLRYSHDNGSTFSDIIKISDNGAFPIIDVEGSDVYIVFMELIDDIRNIVLVMSNDAGNTFSKVSIYRNGILPRLAIEGSLICISWVTIDDINNRIGIACSIDKSNIIINEIHIPNKISMYKVSIEGSNIYLVWLEEDELKIAVSNDLKRFNYPFTIGSGDINRAGIVASGSNVYAIWSELLCNDQRCNSIDTKVYLRVSHDSGKSFSNIITLG